MDLSPMLESIDILPEDEPSPISSPARSEHSGNRPTETPEKKRAKKFAWMSDGDISSSDDEVVSPVPLLAFKEVTTLAQMERAVKEFMPRMRDASLDEIMQSSMAVAKTGYFLGSFMEQLFDMVTEKAQYLPKFHILMFLKNSSSVNAYHPKCFSACLQALANGVGGMDDLRRAILKEVFSQVRHEGDEEVLERLLNVNAVNTLQRKPCVNFFRGMCKYDQRCHFSHHIAVYEEWRRKEGKNLADP